MIRVLSRAQSRAFDEHIIGQCGVPGILLMENAGRAVADVVVGRVTTSATARVVIVCGTGNNGGDGFVVARHLLARGLAVDVFLVGDGKRVRDDAKTNFEAYRGVGGHVVELKDEPEAKSEFLRVALAKASVAVDALFGTGLDRPIAGAAAWVVHAFNEARCEKIAVDIPSGLHADTGATLGVCVEADLTVTFGHYKLGLLTPGGAKACGLVVVAGLGVPLSVADAIGYDASILERSDVSTTLRPRHPGTHKNGAGHVVVFAGSKGKVGAALMSARAALRAGSGMVTIATWPDAADLLEGRIPEVMVRRISRGDVAGSAAEILEGKRAVVMGPGFGTDDDARTVVEHILGAWEGPSVVDADALSLFADRPEVFAASKGATVLTPHPGEAGRLLGSTSAAVEGDRFAAIASLVDRARCVVLLKGAHTLVGAPEERVVINTTGNAALATAGTGDVLSGIIGALLCTADPFEAACAGVYLHGVAAEGWANAHGRADRGLLAGEIADRIPAAIATLTRAHARWPV